MGITIVDVARAAGVSPTTVSRAFNNSHLVKEDTRTRIRRIAAELRYVPNGTARSLVLQKTEVLGLILPKPHEEFFLEVIRDTDEATCEAGYRLLISSTYNRLRDVRHAIQMMHGRVDGLLVITPHHGASQLLDVLPPDLPVVFLQSSVKDEPYDCFRLANRQGAYEAVRHLIELGHRRIALIKSEDENIETRERLQGVSEALSEAGIPLDESLIYSGFFTQETGYEAGLRIAAMPSRPTAIFAFDDYIAIGALRAVLQAGLSVPTDMAIIGFDDVVSARLTAPPLSSIQVPVKEMCYRAVSRLIEIIEDRGRPEPESVELPTRLVVRASTMPA